jgi:hypothetical protein
MSYVPMTLSGALDFSIAVTHEIYKDAPREEHDAAVLDVCYSFLKAIRRSTWMGRFFL